MPKRRPIVPAPPAIMDDGAEDDSEEVDAVLLSELESLSYRQVSTSPSYSSAPFSSHTISALQSLIDGSYSPSSLASRLSAFNVSASSLILPLSAALDSLPDPLPAANALLSLLLLIPSISSPVALLSLFRFLRRSLKASSQDSNPRCRRASSSRKRNLKADSFDSSSSFSNVFESLEKVLSLIRLDSSPDCLKSLVDTIASIFAAGRQEESSLRMLMLLISRPEHGDQMASSVEVFKSLSPIILSATKSPSRSSALAFVTKRVAPLGRENEKIRRALLYLPRFLALKAPERSEPRLFAVESITEIVKTALEQEERLGFVEFAMKMATGKSQWRLLATDLLLALLTSMPDLLEDATEWGLKCLNGLISRCSDFSGGVRARALTNMAQLVGFFSENSKYLDKLKKFVTFGDSSFMELLRQRCADEKAVVRKAALVLVAKLSSSALIGSHLDEVLLRALGSACSDPLVSIRKAALTALSEIFRRSPNIRVVGEWLHSVPCLIMDNESSIQEECENLFLELVLDKIASAGNRRTCDDPTSLELLTSGGVLDLLKGMCDGEVMPCVKKICASLGKKKKLKLSIATSLQNIITISESVWRQSSMPIEMWVAPPGAWQLFAEVSLFIHKGVDWKFLHHHWQLLDKLGVNAEKIAKGTVEPGSMLWAGCRVSLLQTISNVSIELPPESAADLAHNLLVKIEVFDMHLSEVDAHVKTLAILCKRKATNHNEGNNLILKWVHQVLTKAQDVLENYLSKASKTVRNNKFPTPPSRRTKEKRKVSEERQMLRAVTAVFTVGSLALVCPTSDLQGIVPLLHSIITSGNSEPRPKELAGLPSSMKENSPSLYIHSWVTMGKICLVDDVLAKRYIPLFVQELEHTESAPLRNNIMVVMADFCVRHTALVDCYIPKITLSLRDPCEVVRRQTFILLSRLLQRDYVKWRGTLFHRFLLCLVDESEKIRHLADFLFGKILKVKAPLLAYNSFVEAIFVLNDCNAHSGHTEGQVGHKKGLSIFSIRGNDEKSRSQRMCIYISLLKQMAPEHLLATSAKLCAEILGAASDGLLNVDDATGLSVLQDALQILSCKEMRLHSTRSVNESAEIDDETAAEGSSGGITGVVLAARGRVVTHVAKKNLIHTAVPIFIELKRVLESKNSPAIGCLMDCLCVLLRDYKDEFDEILVADKQLRKELLYDMQKHEAASKANPRAVEADTATAVRRQTKEHGGATAAEATGARGRSALREVNRDTRTPPLHSLSVPKLKSNVGGHGGASGGSKPTVVLESLRQHQTFDSDQEN